MRLLVATLVLVALSPGSAAPALGPGAHGPDPALMPDLSGRWESSGWGTVTLRERQGRAFVTDSGNYILDLHAGPLTDPGALDRQIQAVPGVVETGLFIARADVVVVASEQGIRELRPR